MDWLPVVALVPLQEPEALQAVVLAELQVSIAAVPVARLVGRAVRESVGVGALEVLILTAALWGDSLSGIALSIALIL